MCNAALVWTEKLTFLFKKKMDTWGKTQNSWPFKQNIQLENLFSMYILHVAFPVFMCLIFVHIFSPLGIILFFAFAFTDSFSVSNSSLSMKCF